MPEKDEDMLRNSVYAVAHSASCPFQNGDPVYLAKGSYEGTVGTFLNLRTDPQWADIREPDHNVRAHPVEWMALSASSSRGMPA